MLINIIIPTLQQQVQTEPQYIFIHEALIEYLSAGGTEITVNDHGLRDYLKQLQQSSDNVPGETNLDTEFQVKLNYNFLNLYSALKNSSSL